jgi:glycosyltransferase involved in cell wall biosynthesis
LFERTWLRWRSIARSLEARRPGEGVGELNEAPTLAVLFEDFGPYHVARIDALAVAAREVGSTVVGVRFRRESITYQWSPCELRIAVSRTLLPDGKRRFETSRIVLAWCRVLREERVDIAFIPSYSPAVNALCLLTARIMGVRCVMMNDSWAATERANGLTLAVKRMLLRLYDGALVAGVRHRDHFVRHGMDPTMIELGFDAVDNDFFSVGTDRIRAASVRMGGLPSRYILNVGRMIPVKNLATLIDAYALLVRERSDMPALVLVGDGPCRRTLMHVAEEQGLLVAERDFGSNEAPPPAPAVVFFPFGQLDQLLEVYAFASVFVLPSHGETWGLVVNEAMASGLPVVVSERAGCVPDLVSQGENGFSFDPTDARALKDLLAQFVDSAELVEQFGRASRRIVGDFGPDRFASGALAVVAKLISGRRR